VQGIQDGLVQVLEQLHTVYCALQAGFTSTTGAIAIVQSTLDAHVVATAAAFITAGTERATILTRIGGTAPVPLDISTGLARTPYNAASGAQSVADAVGAAVDSAGGIVTLHDAAYATRVTLGTPLTLPSAFMSNRTHALSSTGSYPGVPTSLVRYTDPNAAVTTDPAVFTLPSDPTLASATRQVHGVLGSGAQAAGPYGLDAGQLYTVSEALEMLLNATGAQHDAEDVGFQPIAQRVGVAPASALQCSSIDPTIACSSLLSSDSNYITQTLREAVGVRQSDVAPFTSVSLHQVARTLEERLGAAVYLPNYFSAARAVAAGGATQATPFSLIDYAANPLTATNATGVPDPSILDALPTNPTVADALRQVGHIVGTGVPANDGHGVEGHFTVCEALEGVLRAVGSLTPSAGDAPLVVINRVGSPQDHIQGNGSLPTGDTSYVSQSLMTAIGSRVDSAPQPLSLHAVLRAMEVNSFGESSWGVNIGSATVATTGRAAVSNTAITTPAFIQTLRQSIGQRGTVAAPVPLHTVLARVEDATDRLFALVGPQEVASGGSLVAHSDMRAVLGDERQIVEVNTTNGSIVKGTRDYSTGESLLSILGQRSDTSFDAASGSTTAVNVPLHAAVAQLHKDVRDRVGDAVVTVQEDGASVQDGFSFPTVAIAQSIREATGQRLDSTNGAVSLHEVLSRVQQVLQSHSEQLLQQTGASGLNDPTTLRDLRGILGELAPSFQVTGTVGNRLITPIAGTDFADRQSLMDILGQRVRDDGAGGTEPISLHAVLAAVQAHTESTLFEVASERDGTGALVRRSLRETVGDDLLTVQILPRTGNTANDIQKNGTAVGDRQSVSQILGQRVEMSGSSSVPVSLHEAIARVDVRNELINRSASSAYEQLLEQTDSVSNSITGLSLRDTLGQTGIDVTIVPGIGTAGDTVGWTPVSDQAELQSLRETLGQRVAPTTTTPVSLHEVLARVEIQSQENADALASIDAAVLPASIMDRSLADVVGDVFQQVTVTAGTTGAPDTVSVTPAVVGDRRGIAENIGQRVDGQSLHEVTACLSGTVLPALPQLQAGASQLVEMNSGTSITQRSFKTIIGDSVEQVTLNKSSTQWSTTPTLVTDLSLVQSLLHILGQRSDGTNPVSLHQAVADVQVDVHALSTALGNSAAPSVTDILGSTPPPEVTETSTTLSGQPYNVAQSTTPQQLRTVLGQRVDSSANPVSVHEVLSRIEEQVSTVSTSTAAPSVTDILGSTLPPEVTEDATTPSGTPFPVSQSTTLQELRTVLGQRVDSSANPVSLHQVLNRMQAAQKGIELQLLEQTDTSGTTTERSLRQLLGDDVPTVSVAPVTNAPDNVNVAATTAVANRQSIMDILGQRLDGTASVSLHEAVASNARDTRTAVAELQDPQHGLSMLKTAIESNQDNHLPFIAPCSIHFSTRFASTLQEAVRRVHPAMCNATLEPMDYASFLTAFENGEVPFTRVSPTSNVYEFNISFKTGVTLQGLQLNRLLEAAARNCAGLPFATFPAGITTPSLNNLNIQVSAGGSPNSAGTRSEQTILAWSSDDSCNFPMCRVAGVSKAQYELCRIAAGGALKAVAQDNLPPMRLAVTSFDASTRPFKSFVNTPAGIVSGTLTPNTISNLKLDSIDEIAALLRPEDVVDDIDFQVAFTDQCTTTPNGSQFVPDQAKWNAVSAFQITNVGDTSPGGFRRYVLGNTQVAVVLTSGATTSEAFVVRVPAS